MCSYLWDGRDGKRHKGWLVGMTQDDCVEVEDNMFELQAAQGMERMVSCGAMRWIANRRVMQTSDIQTSDTERRGLKQKSAA